MTETGDEFLDAILRGEIPDELRQESDTVFDHLSPDILAAWAATLAVVFAATHVEARLRYAPTVPPGIVMRDVILGATRQVVLATQDWESKNPESPGDGLILRTMLGQFLLSTLDLFQDKNFEDVVLRSLTDPLTNISDSDEGE